MMKTDQTDRQVNILLVDDEPDAYLVLKLTMKKVKSPLINLDYVGDIGSAVDWTPRFTGFLLLERRR